MVWQSLLAPSFRIEWLCLRLSCFLLLPLPPAQAEDLVELGEGNAFTLFQDFCLNTILAGRFLRSSVGSLSRSFRTGLHSMAFLASPDTIFSVSGTQLRVMFNPALHLLHSVLDYPACSSFKGSVLFWEGQSACLIPSYIYGLDNTCLNTRLNTSTEVKPVFISTASGASLHITTRRL